MNENHEPKANEPDAVAMLVRLAGKRGAASDEGTRRAREAARATWRDTVRRKSRRRLFALGGTLAAAAAIVLLITAGPIGRKDTVAMPDVPAARVEAVLGEAWSQTPGPDDSPRQVLVPGVALPLETALSTGDDGRTAIHLASGHSLRLDGRTRVRLLASGRVALERGAIYVSTPLGRTSGAAIEVQTPFGAIREIGTQFEARLTATTLRLRLREGEAVLSDGGAEHRVGAGLQLVVGVDGSVTRGAIAPYDAEWDWVLALAPRFDLEGRSALDFLQWIARERGLTLMIEDQPVAHRAAETMLSGRLGRLSIDRALDAVLPTCGLTYRVDEGRLYVADRPARPGSRR